MQSKVFLGQYCLIKSGINLNALLQAQFTLDPSKQGRVTFELLCEIDRFTEDRDKIEAKNYTSEENKQAELKFKDNFIELLRKYYSIYTDTNTKKKPQYLPDTPTTAASDSDPMAVFRAMPSLRFNEVTMGFDPGHLTVQIKARKISRKVPLITLGFVMKNRITLNAQGRLFKELAENIITISQKNKALERLSKNLRDAFSTSDPPFRKNRPKFKLYIPKERSAKWAAKLKTQSLDKNNMPNTTDWLEKNDADYDPSDPIYSHDDHL